MTRREEVLALSLWRPWSYCILRAGKEVENRPWATKFRGLLVLHSGTTVQEPIARRLIADGHPPAEVVACGFVGTVVVKDCHSADDCRSCSHWASPEGFHWVLADPQPFRTPIPGPGRQRLFTPPAEVLDLLCSEGRVQ